MPRDIRRPLAGSFPRRTLVTVAVAASMLPVYQASLATPAGAVAPAAGAAMPTGPKGLSSSGQVLPDTNYTIPAKAIFISPKGKDTNKGTKSAPVQTLNRAVALAPSNGTIVFRSGTYRDWYHDRSGGSYAIVDKALTFQAYPHESPWLDGTDYVPASAFTKTASNRWSLGWATPQFCEGKYYSRALNNQSKNPNSGPCAHWDMASTPSNPAAADPQMVFLNGKQLKQVSDPKQLDAGSFFYDWSGRKVVLGFNPSGKTLEVSKRPVAMILGGKHNYTVRGLGFRRFATNEYHNMTAAALYVGRSVSRVENTVFTNNAAGGLAYSSPQPGSKVSRSVFVDNGFTPLQGSGNAQQGTDNDFVVDSNVLMRNNTQGFGERCSVSCGQAAVKLARMRGLRVSNNLVAENRLAAGIWCDLDCSDTQIVYNVVRDNTGSGIMYEVSNKAVIAGNLSVRNQYGINVPSANTKVYNNTLVDNMQGIKVYDDQRTRGRDGWDDIGPDTRNVEVVNNVVSGRNYSLLAMPMQAKSTLPNTGAVEQLSRVDYNSFHQSNGSSPTYVYWQTLNGKQSYYRSRSQFQKDHGFDGHSLWSNSTTNVFAGSGDYRVTSTSGAYKSAATLPKDVAAALGVAPSGLSRGAFAPSTAPASVTTFKVTSRRAASVGSPAALRPSKVLRHRPTPGVSVAPQPLRPGR